MILCIKTRPEYSLVTILTELPDLSIKIHLLSKLDVRCTESHTLNILADLYTPSADMFSEGVVFLVTARNLCSERPERAHVISYKF
jgi:hypothetical protein